MVLCRARTHGTTAPKERYYRDYLRYYRKGMWYYRRGLRYYPSEEKYYRKPQDSNIKEVFFLHSQ